MGLYRRDNLFWFSIMQNGRRVQVSTKADNKKLAERIYAKALTEIQEGRWFEGVKAKTITVEYLLERYFNERLKTKSKNTIMRDQTLKKHIVAYFGKHMLVEITPEAISEYRQKRYDRDKSVATVNREMAFLRNAFNVAMSH